MICSRGSSRTRCLAVGLFAILALTGCSSDGTGTDQNAAGNVAGFQGIAGSGVGPWVGIGGGGGGVAAGAGGQTEPFAEAGSTQPAAGAGGIESAAGSGGQAGAAGRAAVAGSSDDADTAGSVDAGIAGSGDAEFDACMASLKQRCMYDEMETACSSMITPTIPLTDGSTWGNTELLAGPYGGYVEWNEGADFANVMNPGELTCDIAAGAFMEPASVTADVLDLRGQDLTLYTVFRPACTREGEKYPVITWGNGTCGQAGGYGSFLVKVASHGFYVFAANSRWTGSGIEILHALDLAAELNDDPDSVYYQKLDLDRIGVMGHSQGASGTQAASSDPRIKSVILWNGGDAAAVNKPVMAISGERDIGNPSVMTLSSEVNLASQPAAWLYYHQVLLTGGGMTGHLTVMEQPERVWEPALAWFQYTLNDDPAARDMLLGDSCGLCTRTDEFEYGHNSHLK